MPLPNGAKHATKHDPCPYCGGGVGHCWIDRARGSMWCACRAKPDPFRDPGPDRNVDTSSPIQADGATWFPKRSKTGRGDGRTFIRQDVYEQLIDQHVQAKADPQRAAELKAKQAEAEAERARQEAEEIERAQANAAETWAACREYPRDRVAQYLKSRLGVDVDPEQLPPTVRYHPSLFHRDHPEGWPAMVLAVQTPPSVTGDQRRLQTLHRIYLATNGAGNASKDDAFLADNAKLLLGRPGGGAICLPGKDPDTLALCEGFETAAAIHRATKWSVWACVSDSGLVNVKLGPDCQGVKRVVVCGDLDRSAAGQIAAWKLAARVKQDHPSIRVDVALPASRVASQQVRAVTLDEAGDVWDNPTDIIERCPRIVIDGTVDLPIDEKSVDWLDVFLQYGAETSDVIERSCRKLTLKGASVAGSGNNRDGAQPPASEQGSESAGNGEDDGKRLLPEQWGITARWAIEELFLIDGHESDPRTPGVDLSEPFVRPVGGGGVTVRHVSRHADDDGQWETWNRGAWKRISTQTLRGMLHEWLEGFWVLNRKTQVKTPYRVNIRDLGELIDALSHFTSADVGQRAAAWLKADRTDDGVELTSGRRETRVLRPRGWKSEDLPSPDKVLALKSRLLDVEAFLGGELRTFPHSPRYYGPPPLEFDLPYRELGEAMQADASAAGDVGAGDSAVAELIAEHTPHWSAHLEHVSGGDKAFPISLMRAMGLSVLGDTSEEVIVLLMGKGGSGKGSTMAPWRAILGPELTMSLDINSMQESHAFETIINRKLMEVPDVVKGKFMDAGAVAGILKQISGGDPLRVNKKFRSAIPEYRPQCMIVMSSNQMLDLPDPGNALRDRLLVFPFTQGVRGTDQQDRRYKQRLEAEAPGVLMSALHAVRELYQDAEAGRTKFPEPQLSAQLRTEFAERANPVGTFMDWYVEAGHPGDDGEPTEWLPTMALHGAYSAYRESVGMTAYSVGDFTLKLRSHDTGLQAIHRKHPDYENKRLRGFGPLRWKKNADGKLAVLELTTKAEVVGDDSAFDWKEGLEDTPAAA